MGVAVGAGVGGGVGVAVGVGVGGGVGVAVGAGVGDGVGVAVGAGVGVVSAPHPIDDSARMEQSAASQMVWAKVRGFTTGCCFRQIKLYIPLPWPGV